MGENGQFGDQDIVTRGKGFGDDFAKYKDHKCHDPGGQTYGVIGKQVDRQRGRNGRGGHIDHVVADQNGGQQLVRIILHAFDQLVGSDILFGQMSGPGSG